MTLPHITVVGAGQVGATTAHLLALKGVGNVTLIDVVDGLAQGKALDMTQSAPIDGFPGWVRGSTDFGAMRDSRLVVVTAGLPRKPGMSRDDLLAANAKIVGPIAARAAETAPEAVLIIVTNPLDVMVALSLQRSGFPRARVMGMAGVLDGARLRAFIAERLQVSPTDVEAMVLGSHGDLMVPVKGAVSVQGRPITERLGDDEIEQLFQRTRDGGAEIVRFLKQGSAFYAPASGVVEMAIAILRDQRRTLPVCAALEGEYGLRDVCLGVPAELSIQGITRIVELDLSPEERLALAASAEKVRHAIKSLQGIQAEAT